MSVDLRKVSPKPSMFKKPTPLCIRCITLLDAADIARSLINHGMPFTCCGTYFEIPGAHAATCMHIIDNELAPTRYVVTG